MKVMKTDEEQRLYELYLKEKKQAEIAIRALWLLDTHKEAQDALKVLGLWKTEGGGEMNKQTTLNDKELDEKNI